MIEPGPFHTGSVTQTGTPKSEAGPLSRLKKFFFGDDGIGFGDVLDAVNPLQHIPVISSIYRKLTGDEIAGGPRILGGALIGGPIGAGLAALSAALDQTTGNDLGGHVADAVLPRFDGRDRSAEPDPVATAAADSPALRLKAATAYGTQKWASAASTVAGTWA